MREYYVYKHTNKINGKCYIGQTCNVVKRWKPYSYKYCTKFYDAIKKYGWNNFAHEVLRVCTKDDVDFYEAYYVKLYNSIENGYNLESGGQTNKTHSKETIEKIREVLEEGYRYVDVIGKKMYFYKGANQLIIECLFWK